MVNGHSTGMATAFGADHAAELVEGFNTDEAREVRLDPEYDAWSYRVFEGPLPSWASTITVHSSVAGGDHVHVEVFDEYKKSVGFL